MAKQFGLAIATFCFLLGFAVADWNILNQNRKNLVQNGLQISLKNYCEAWRMNVELHNIRDFKIVPEECVEYIKKYMTSTQYTIDSERTIDECRVYISTSCGLEKDGKDAWIFDIDETLLSTVPYYKKNGAWGDKLNLTSLEEWMKKGKATALDHSLKLFNELKAQGVQIFLVSSRRETLRSATVDNLVDVGYFGWTSLILRSSENDNRNVEQYKAGVRQDLINKGYRIYGVVGDQWSSIQGLPSAIRTFKLPNPLYYVA